MIVSATAVTVVVVMAASAFAMLMVMSLAVMVAIGFTLFGQLSAEEGENLLFHITGCSGVNLNAGSAEAVDRSTANATANQAVNTMIGQEAD